MNKKKIVIVGCIDSKHPTGPSNVINSLNKGLGELNMHYEFINSFTGTIKEKIAFYIKLFMLVFSRDLIINVHTYGYAISTIVTLISEINKKNKYFLTVHGISSCENNLNGIKTSKKKKAVEKYIFEKMPNIICVSNFAKIILEEMYDRQKNIYVIHNGLPKYTSEYTPKNKNRMNFVYAGGYSNLKGPIECLEIFENINKVYPNATLTMCGPVINIELLKNVETFVQKSKMKNNVLIKQKLSPKDLELLYIDSLFILAPSLLDTFNMTVLEAMNRGCIPIVSVNCGIKDILENESGFIYTSINDIVNWLRDINIESESRKCFEISLRTTYIEMAKKYLDIMELVDE